MRKIDIKKNLIEFFDFKYTIIVIAVLAKVITIYLTVILIYNLENLVLKTGKRFN